LVESSHLFNDRRDCGLHNRGICLLQPSL